MRVTQLNIYPIKSCGGIELHNFELLPIGPKFDRTLVLVDEKGRFLSERTLPRMCLIRPSIADLSSDTVLVKVSAPNMPRHEILLDYPACYSNNSVRTITIHKDTCRGIDLGNNHAAWFSEFLGSPCRLIRQVTGLPRVRRPSSLGHDIEVSYADGYPLLVISEASLTDLNSRIRLSRGERVPMNRFRPNIVVANCNPYEEDTWTALRIGDVELKGANKCIRCVVTTTNQKTGERGSEPLRILSTYRKSQQSGVEFGRNFVVSKCGQIAVGDKVEVLKAIPKTVG